MLKPKETFPIEDVSIHLTFPDGQEELFLLEAPNGGDPYKFGFSKISKLDDYRDAENKIQRGSFFYQLFATYDYQSHQMDLKKLLVASNIRLRFPPLFGDKNEYNSADVLLANEEIVKNYLDGLAIASDLGETVPSGNITLEFEGIEAFTEVDLFKKFRWFGGEGEGGGRGDDGFDGDDDSDPLIDDPDPDDDPDIPTIFEPPPPEDVEHLDMVAIFTERVGDGSAFPYRQAIKPKNWPSFSSVHEGPDEDPNVGNLPVVNKAWTDPEGVVHFIYTMDDYEIRYRTFTGNFWSEYTSIGFVGNKFRTMGIYGHNGIIYIFFIPNNSSMRLWNSETKTDVAVPINTEIGSGTVGTFSNSSSNPLIITDQGRIYIAYTIGVLVIQWSDDKGETWDSTVFADFAPINHEFTITDPLGMAFVKDKTGQIFLAFYSYADERIIRLSEATWNESFDLITEIDTSQMGGLNYVIDAYNNHHILYVTSNQSIERITGYSQEYSQDFSDELIDQFPSFILDRFDYTENGNTPTSGGVPDIYVQGVVSDPDNILRFDRGEFSNPEDSFKIARRGFLKWLQPPTTFPNTRGSFRMSPVNNTDGSYVGFALAWNESSSWLNSSGYVLIGDGVSLMRLLKKSPGDRSLRKVGILRVGYEAVSNVDFRFQRGLFYNSFKFTVFIGGIIPATLSLTDNEPLGITSTKFGIIHFFYGHPSGWDQSQYARVENIKVINMDSAITETESTGADAIVHFKDEGNGWVEEIINLDESVPSEELCVVSNGLNLYCGFSQQSASKVIIQKYTDGVGWEIFQEIPSSIFLGSSVTIANYSFLYD